MNYHESLLSSVLYDDLGLIDLNTPESDWVHWNIYSSYYKIYDKSIELHLGINREILFSKLEKLVNVIKQLKKVDSVNIMISQHSYPEGCENAYIILSW